MQSSQFHQNQKKMNNFRILTRQLRLSDLRQRFRTMLGQNSIWIKEQQVKRISALGFGLILVGTGIHYGYLYVKSGFDLVYADSEINKKILQRCSYLTHGHFFPTPYLPNAFGQIIWGTLFDPPMPKLFQRELYQLKDGGQVSLDWMLKDNPKNIVVVCHGLTGGSDSNYIKDALYRLYEAGYSVVCVNQRGVAGTKLTTPKYHSHVDPSDLAEAVDSIQERYPNANLYGVGFSIGANMVLRYAGMKPEQCKFQAIVSIANPFNLKKCADNIHKASKIIYANAITKNFIWLANNHLDQLKHHQPIDLNAALKARTPREFDEAFTMRLYGFSDVDEMYAEIGCENYLENVRVPVLCLNSKRDPISPYDAIPFEKISQNKNIILALTSAGCHVEWFSGLIPERVLIHIKQQQWIMNPTIDYLNCVSSN